MKQLTIAIDFDGVIHAYTSGWKGPLVIADGPMPGAFDFITRVVSHRKVKAVIYSARLANRPEDGGPEGVVHAMQAWFRKYGLPEGILRQIEFHTGHGKPAAIIYIDDRGHRFQGSFPSVKTMLEGMPVWKPNSGTVGQTVTWMDITEHPLPVVRRRTPILIASSSGQWGPGTLVPQGGVISDIKMEARSSITHWAYPTIKHPTIG